jgi:hypothetical protein
MAGIDEPNLAAFLPHISPKLIYFQAVIITFVWAGLYAGTVPPTTFF